MKPNEKIQLDDITFDDVIAGDGVDTVAIDDIEQPVEETKEETTDKLEISEVEKEKEVVEDSPEEDVDNEKDDLEKSSDDEDSVDDTVVSEVLSKLGYELDSEFADTADGLADMTKEVASKMADDRIDEVLEAFPLVKEHLQYVLAGGASTNFMKAYDPNLDYSTFELAEDDVRSQKAILSDYFTEKGHDKEFIKEMLEDYEDSGKLHGKADAAKQALGKQQSAQREQLVQQEKQARATEAAQQEEFWGGVADTIKNSKEFSGLQVSEKEKGKFFNYLSQPVDKNGYTQRDLDHANAEMETKLAIDYLMYKGFNLEKIINTKAKTKQSKSLRDKISKNEEKVKSAKKASRTTKSFDVDDLDLSL
tara:strand:+ start:3064 stop:4155 length:1092 start_codon:yes stop_codon:yes gene_type:complete